MKAKLLELSKTSLSKKDSKVCDKRRRNIFVDAIGLSGCFAPKLVRETIFKDSDGSLKSAATGRDGRLFHVGTTNKSIKYLKEGAGKFSSSWVNTCSGGIWKSKKVSYLCAVVAQNGLNPKSIKPLVRLSVQFPKLDFKSFNALFKVCVSLNSSDKVRRTTALKCQQSKPFLTGSVKILPKVGTVPLWDWKEPRKGSELPLKND